MSYGRALSIALTAAFLLIIFGVPLSQAAFEMVRGERPQALELVLHLPTKDNLRLFEKEMDRASWAVQLSRPWMQFLQFTVLGHAGRDALYGRDGWFFFRPGVRYLIEPLPVPGKDADPLAAILAFKKELDSRGIALLVAPAPGKASIYPEQLTRRAKNLAEPVNPRTRALIARLRESGVDVVDLFELFGESGRSGLYLAQDSHWSPAGMEFAAETVARYVREQGWLAPGGVSYSERPAPVERLGDLLLMMQAPPVERLFEPERVDCRQVVRDDSGELYEDDPASPVLVLGDSFLRIYQLDEPRAAGFSAHLARHLGMPVASVINDGGASTLVRQELARKPELLVNKRVVIWEFVERDIRFGTEGWQIVPLPPAS
ncbi:MAG TPA: hypothetical protein PLJ71_05985 [Candidatus Hydrogenedentes bacterium]|nr:hypothetical protein [Candidatus Hydrogenedentota bacterium]HQM48218.1 hypothetical protein [Candidatus Hydrogenedentota bacterium]